MTETRTVPRARRRALDLASAHLLLDGYGVRPPLPVLLDRARAYAAFLSEGAMEKRAEMLGLARDLADEGDDVVERARRLLRYVEEGA